MWVLNIKLSVAGKFEKQPLILSLFINKCDFPRPILALPISKFSNISYTGDVLTDLDDKTCPLCSIKQNIVDS